MTADPVHPPLQVRTLDASPSGDPPPTPWHRSLADVTPEVVEKLSTTLPLYRRKLHTIAGDGESGKTWIASWCVVETARADGRALVLDGEMSESSWRLRLTQLGLEDTPLHRVRYASMGEATADRLRWDVNEFDLVIIDSAVTYLSRFARSENDNAEVTRAYDPVVAAARSGPAVVIVDHLARTSATAVPRGATAKFTAVDVAFGVTLSDGSSPSREADWSSVITVEKDRDALIGSRRDYSARFTPLGDGALNLDLTESWSESHRLSSSAADSAMARLRRLDPPPTSGNDAFKRIGGTRAHALTAYRTWREEQVEAP